MRDYDAWLDELIAEGRARDLAQGIPEDGCYTDPLALDCPSDSCAIVECESHGHCCAVSLHEGVGDET